MNQKRAIVIGATSGIGEAIAIRYAKKGYKVGITGRREERLLALKAKYPDSFMPKVFDITTDENVQHLEALVKELGGLDLLVMNSGYGEINKNLDPVLELRTVRTNVVGFTEIIVWSSNYFEHQGHGHLVSISSVAGKRGSKLAPSYNASKSFQNNYMEGLRQRAKTRNLDVHYTDIRPGFVDTDMLKGNGAFWVASIEKATDQIQSAMEKKKKVAYVTKRWQLVAMILGILPRWMHERM